MRPAEPQVPVRDLSVTAMTPLDEITFEQWSSFGVKTANLATLRAYGFPEGTVPDGAGVPFYFCDEFMKYNGFYDQAAAMLADPDFHEDYGLQEAALAEFRNLLKTGDMPKWMWDALTDLQASFSEGTSIRCRSSTNNEDLPGFQRCRLVRFKDTAP
jgi:phosphoenolpyruvate synthase/pyruvate phosphate dikinase